MGLSFKNSPLVEIIAELQWDLPWVNQSVQESGPIVSMSGPVANQHEEFYMRFGSKVAAAGFQRIERLIPPHFPQLPYQPVYRFRHNSEDIGARIYQLGAGFFSVNATPPFNSTPPYQSWVEFQPVVSAGVDALLQSWSDSEKSNNFNKISLRYIDAFKKELTNNLSLSSFMETLGFKIDIPDAILHYSSNQGEIQPMLQLTIPVDFGQLNISFADGVVSNEQAIIMDILVSYSTAKIGCTKDEVMTAFELVHMLIYSMHFELTKPLNGLMQSEETKPC